MSWQTSSGTDEARQAGRDAFNKGPETLRASRREAEKQAFLANLAGGINAGIVSDDECARELRAIGATEDELAEVMDRIPL